MAPELEDTELRQELWRHVKTHGIYTIHGHGTFGLREPDHYYTILCLARLQTSNRDHDHAELTVYQSTTDGTLRVELRDSGPLPPALDGCEVVIYQSIDNGSDWVRSISEFHDGRFERLHPVLPLELP